MNFIRKIRAAETEVALCSSVKWVKWRTHAHICLVRWSWPLHHPLSSKMIMISHIWLDSHKWESSMHELATNGFCVIFSILKVTWLVIFHKFSCCLFNITCHIWAAAPDAASEGNVIQRRGRFQVTSDNPAQKVPGFILQKSFWKLIVNSVFILVLIMSQEETLDCLNLDCDPSWYADNCYLQTTTVTIVYDELVLA
jgi:hypothetical protein